MNIDASVISQPLQPCRECMGNSLVKGCNKGVWYIYCALCHERDGSNNGMTGASFDEVCDKWNSENDGKEAG